MGVVEWASLATVCVTSTSRLAVEEAVANKVKCQATLEHVIEKKNLQ